MKNSQKLAIGLIYIIVFIMLFSKFFSLTLEIDKINYSILLLSYLICGAIFISTIFKKTYYIFEPYTIVSLLYIAIMIYRPCIDIYNGNYYRFGIYVMDGCLNATIIFTISFIFFSIGYNYSFVNKKNNIEERKGRPLSDYTKCYSKKIKIISLILFIIGFLSAIIFYKTSGYNPLAFLKNINQSENMYLYDSKFKFLAKISYIMIIPWIIICKFDKSKILKFTTTIAMFTIFLIGGSRYIIVITVLAYITLPYIVERKSFKFKKAIILFLILLIFSDIIAYTRVGTRTGKSIDFMKISEMVEITDVFDSDLTIYKPFYCVVNSIPKNLPHQYGKGLIGYSIFSFFPRFLFPWKSNFDNMAKIISIVMNETAMKAGLAMPNVGEYYLEFGLIGCIVFMYIFGIICRKMKSLYLNNKNSINEIILYSVLCPFLMQIVCRGYLAVQLNTLIFIVLPYYLLKKEFKKIELNDNEF